LVLNAGLGWQAADEYSDQDALLARGEVDQLFVDNVARWYPRQAGSYLPLSVLSSARELSPEQTGLRGEERAGCD
jgi:hypothetical protein